MTAESPWDASLDALVAAPGQHRLVFENAHVRVLDTRIAPGERTPVHTHRWPAAHYVVSWSDFVRRDAAGAALVDTRALRAHKELLALAGPRTSIAMDVGAEFTLQIARFAQERFDAPRSAARWQLLPGGAPLTWAAARAALAALPKPAMVAPLSEPGALGVWLPDALDAERRAWFQDQLANQLAYWQATLKVCGVSMSDPVVFEPATPDLVLTGREFLQWASDYVIGVPVTMRRIADGTGARFLIMAPGGGGPPLGLTDPYAPAS